MRIALMTNNYKPFMGGVPISIERLADGLRGLGHSVTVFAPTYQEQQEEENVFRYATCMKHFIGGVVLPNPFDSRIEKEFREKGFDLIHVHHPMLIGRTAVYLAKKYNIPLVFTYHTRYEQYLSYIKGIDVMERRAVGKPGVTADFSAGCLHLIKDKFMPAYLNTFLRHCDFIFAPTAGMEQYLNQICGVPGEQIGILPTGLEKNHFLVSRRDSDTLRHRYGAADKPLFLTVSRMSHEKNVIFLLESLSRLKKTEHRDFTALFVGDGPDREDYMRLSEELGLSENVIFTGAVPNGEIAPYFSAADAFLFASRTETQGIVVLEAFAGGAPVLAVEASGVSDLVRSGYNGILTSEDEEVYAGMLSDFLSDRWNREALSQNAARTAEEYREESVAMRASHYYNRIVAEHAAHKNQSTGLLFGTR